MYKKALRVVFYYNAQFFNFLLLSVLFFLLRFKS